MFQAVSFKGNSYIKCLNSWYVC